MRVLFCGGGTGGHITPALAIAEIIKQKNSNTEAAFVGRLGGNENSAIKKEGYQLYELHVTGLKRALSLKNIGSILRALRSTSKAKGIIRDFKPDVVIGTGGYVSFPVLYAAIKLGVPTLLHESNSYPGLVTRALGRKCDRVLVATERTKAHLKHRENAVVTGNPVRASFHSTDRSKARKDLGIPDNSFFVLSFGGSLGAEEINVTVSEYMKKLTSIKDIYHIHATGKQEFEKYKELSERLKSETENLRIIPYIENMPLYLTACDAVVSRSGAMTLAEICEARKPAILIPSPNVADNHQLENAKALADDGCALLLEEKDLSVNTLAASINALRTTRAKRRNIIQRLTNKKSKDSHELIYKEIEAVLKLHSPEIK